IVAVAMAKDPAERYPTARALALDLARYEAGEPVLARPPGRLRRVVRRARRSVRELAIASLAVLAIVLAFAPFDEAQRRDDDAFLLSTADELIANGESRAAGLLLARVAGRASLSPTLARDLDRRFAALDG